MIKNLFRELKAKTGEDLSNELVTGLPSRINLDKIFKIVDSVSVFDLDFKSDSISWALIFETKDDGEVVDLLHRLKISEEQEGIYIKGIGCILFKFYSNGLLIGEAEYIAPNHISWKELWEGAAWLEDGDSLLRWFKQRSISTNLLNDILELEIREKKEEETSKWLKQSPNAIKTHVEKVTKDINETIQDLAFEIPDKHERILLLMKLLGFTTRQWDNFEYRDTIPQKILMKYDFQDLIHAVQSRELSEEEKFGMSRFFSGGIFNPSLNKNFELIPKSIIEVINSYIRIDH